MTKEALCKKNNSCNKCLLNCDKKYPIKQKKKKNIIPNWECGHNCISKYFPRKKRTSNKKTNKKSNRRKSNKNKN